MSRLCALAAALLFGAPGCVGWTVEPGAGSQCRPWGALGERGLPCQRLLVFGLFPSIGEAHVNGLGTNGKPLNAGLWVADFTLRPVYIAGANLLSLGFPTARGWLLEPYDDWDPAPASCRMSLVGFCKTARVVRGSDTR